MLSNKKDLNPKSKRWLDGTQKRKSSYVKTQEAYCPHRIPSVALPVREGGYPVLVLIRGGGRVEWGGDTLCWSWLSSPSLLWTDTQYLTIILRTSNSYHQSCLISKVIQKIFFENTAVIVVTTAWNVFRYTSKVILPAKLQILTGKTLKIYHVTFLTKLCPCVI